MSYPNLNLMEHSILATLIIRVYKSMQLILIRMIQILSFPSLKKLHFIFPMLHKMVNCIKIKA